MIPDKEVDLLHSLKDIRTILDCLTYNMKRMQEIHTRLEHRLKTIEERVDNQYNKGE